MPPLTLKFILVCQEMDLSACVRQAYDGGAYSYLLEMLRSDSFQESDVSYYLTLKLLAGILTVCATFANFTRARVYRICVSWQWNFICRI